MPKKAFLSGANGSSQLALVDFHSHLMHTEVIGLLGGRYDPDSGLLTISQSFPCRSVSSGTECEMDPMSELEATNYFSKLGLEIVGWYHSHPVFQPDPSIRDLDTQWSYQQLITDQGMIKRPFVGLIVSPYDKNTCAKYPFHSTYQLFCVMGDLDEITMRYQKPVKCPLNLVETVPDISDFQSILDKCSINSAFVNLLDLFGNTQMKETTDDKMKRIDKMKCSLGQHFKDVSNLQLVNEFIEQLKTNLTSSFEECQC